MAITQEVMLVCTHLGRASHDKGGRIITCSTCGVESVVHAKPRTIIMYDVSQVSYQLRMDLGATGGDTPK